MIHNMQYMIYIYIYTYYNMLALRLAAAAAPEPMDGSSEGGGHCQGVHLYN